MLKMLKFLPAVLFPSEKTARKLMYTMGGNNIAMFLDNADLMEHWGYLLKHFRNSTMMKHKVPKIEADHLVIIKDRSIWLLGENDGLGDVAKSEQWYKEYGLKYKIIKNAGHGVNHQQSDLINKEIVNYLARAVV